MTNVGLKLNLYFIGYYRLPTVPAVAIGKIFGAFQAEQGTAILAFCAAAVARFIAAFLEVIAVFEITPMPALIAFAGLVLSIVLVGDSAREAH